MTTNLLLLDLDGTIRRCLSDPKGFINFPTDQEIIPEAAAALERFASIGATIVGCSNQAGVSAGYKSIGECIDEQIKTMELAPQIQAVFFCPDSDGHRCFQVLADGTVTSLNTETFKELHIRSFRKPACGMLKVAMLRYGAQVENTMFVGDREEDRTAAISAGVGFITETGWYASYPESTEPREAV